MDRHDLIYIHPQGALHFLDTALPESVQNKVKEMIAKHIPFTLCRQEYADDLSLEQQQQNLKVATSCMHNGRKYRVALQLASLPLWIHKPLPLAKMVSHFDPAVQVALTLFIEHLNELQCDVCVYGSFSNEYFTQAQYTHAQSDLDLLLIPHAPEKLEQVLMKIQGLQALTSFKIDGELQLPNAKNVAFNELIYALKHQQQQIVVKGFRQISLENITELLGWNTHEFNRCIAVLH